MIFHVTNAITVLDVGQLSEYCQPEILHYHQTVLPVVFGALEVNTVTHSENCTTVWSLALSFEGDRNAAHVASPSLIFTQNCPHFTPLIDPSRTRNTQCRPLRAMCWKCSARTCGLRHCARFSTHFSPDLPLYCRVLRRCFLFLSLSLLLSPPFSARECPFSGVTLENTVHLCHPHTTLTPPPTPHPLQLTQEMALTAIAATAVAAEIEFLPYTEVLH